MENSISLRNALLKLLSQNEQRMYNDEERIELTDVLQNNYSESSNPDMNGGQDASKMIENLEGGNINHNNESSTNNNENNTSTDLSDNNESENIEGGDLNSSPLEQIYENNSSDESESSSVDNELVQSTLENLKSTNNNAVSSDSNDLNDDDDNFFDDDDDEYNDDGNDADFNEKYIKIINELKSDRNDLVLTGGNIRRNTPSHVKIINAYPYILKQNVK